MTRSIVIANQKGGVGKTTTVANLGAALALQGQHVLVVDLDPQGALTVSFGQDPYSIHPSVYDLLLNSKMELQEALIEVENGLQLLPANSELIAAEYKLWKQPDRVSRLKTMLAQLPDAWDFILFDTPPSLGLLTANALVAGHELMVPVSTEYLAMRGVRPLLDTFWQVRDRINAELHLLGLVATMYMPHSLASAQALKEMRKVFKGRMFRTPIPHDEVAMIAPAARQSVLKYQPTSRIAIAYQQLAEEVCHV